MLDRTPSSDAGSSIDDPAQLLWRLWQQGQRPDAKCFLAGFGTLPLPKIVAALGVDQRERWRRAERVQAETYFQEWPALRTDPELALDLVYGEFLIREGTGEHPTLAEYEQRFPDLAEVLRRQLAFHEALGGSGSHFENEASTPYPPPPGSPHFPAAGPATAPVDYDLLHELGRGGMGVVYLARQKSLKRLVALKMLRPGPPGKHDELARFRAEAEAVARLHHPNIVQVYEIGEHAGTPFFSMEYVSGGSLSSRLDGTPLPARSAALLLTTLARAMHHAHLEGIVHRDLKPANVLLGSWLSGGYEPADAGSGGAHPPLDQLTPKITDFGLAKLLDADTGQTRTGDIMGTPSYMPPEQAGGRTQEIGPATDVYALGAILYEMLTGRPPFRAERPLQTMALVLSQDPVPPTRLQPTIPRDLETICLKCLAKEPRKRYSTARELANDLQRFLDGQPIRARPVGTCERLIKWTRRRPAVAALSALSLWITLFGFALVTWKWIEAEDNARAEALARSEADKARDAADKAHREADRARQQAVDEKLQKEAELRRAEVGLYGNRLALAERDWLMNNVVRADATLDLCRPDLRNWEWFHLKRRCQGGLLTLREHSGAVFRVAFLPGGKLASASADGSVRVWDPVSGKLHFTLLGHDRTMVHCVACSPEGSYLASGGDDRVVAIWDAATGQLLRTLRGHAGAVTSVAFGRSNWQMASAGGGTAIIWDVRTGKNLRVLPTFSILNVSVALHPDGTHLAVGSADRPVKIWNISTGEEIRTIDGFGRSLCFSPDGKRLAGGHGNTIRVWDFDTGRELFSLSGHTGFVMGVAFSADGRYIASAGDDRTARVWDTAKPNAAYTLRGHHHLVYSAAFNPDRTRLATASFDGTVRVWNAPTGEHAVYLNGHQRAIQAVAFSTDGRRLASASHDHTARIWDPATGKEQLVFSGHPRWVADVAFSPDNRLAASAGHDHTVKVWDPATGKVLLNYTGHDKAVTGVAFSPDGSRMASAGHDQTVRVWETATGKEQFAVPIPPCPLLGMVRVAFTPDGNRLACVGPDSEVRVWNALTGKEEGTLAGHRGRVTALAFSKDSRRLATASEDRTIKLWDLGAGKEIHTLRGHNHTIRAVAFRPDGKRIASGGLDKTVRLWDAETGVEVFSLGELESNVLAISFSRDGQSLAFGDLRGVVKVVDGSPLPAPVQQR
jgi:WD40 repeat protein/serine/threonine protein kinase